MWRGLWDILLSWQPAIRDFLFNWQTLITGFLALLGAYWTVRGIRSQIAQANKVAEDRLAREEVAARAVLPLALSELASYSRDCIRLLQDYSDGPEVPADLIAPRVPEEIITSFQNAVRFAGRKERDKIAGLLGRLQVQQARLVDLVARRRGHVISEIEATDCTMDAVDVYARINALYDYARQDEEKWGDPTKAELRTALHNGGVWDNQHPAMVRINQMPDN